MVGLTPPPLMIGSAMTSKPIYFDSIDNCAYILGKAEHSARTSITPGCPFRVISGHTDKSTPCPALPPITEVWAARPSQHLAVGL